MVSGTLQTIMAGLACGEPNTISWDILKNHAGFFASCPDWVSTVGARMLAVPCKGEAQVISGESGAVGMGRLAALMLGEAYASMRQEIGLDQTSRVLMFSTEGDTDPENYPKIVWGSPFLTLQNAQVSTGV